MKTQPQHTMAKFHRPNTMAKFHRPTAGARQPGYKDAPAADCVEDMIATAWPPECSELWTHEAAVALGSPAQQPELHCQINELARGIVHDREPEAASAPAPPPAH